MSLNIALINTNLMKPPIGPLGLEYVAETLSIAGHEVDILDLCWENNWDDALASFFMEKDFNLVGITLRNTDDCYYPSCQSFLPEFYKIVNTIRQQTNALIVLGGVGFSVMPELIMNSCQANVGIWQEGEFAFEELAKRIDKKQKWLDVPNLVWHSKRGWQRNPPKALPLSRLPSMKRNRVNNKRYFQEGGQAGVETKRGCSCHCIYCVEPMAKGEAIRTRPPKLVANEFQNLLEQGIDHIYICDSEFNLPAWHARDVCEELVRRKIGEKIQWYSYCLPVPFSLELADLMKRAGCSGVNFGVDNGDERMLKQLKRNFAPDDIFEISNICRKTGLRFLLDFLLGTPGETIQSITKTIELAKQVEPDVVGITLGVRVYPGTALARLIQRENSQAGLIGGEETTKPLFFMEPLIMPTAYNLINDLIGKDDRFLFLEYNTNQLLFEAIRKGYRGAFWDILHRYSKAEQKELVGQSVVI